MAKTHLSQWAALQAVVDEGSFQKAANKLHRSQSSVSYAVQTLQDGLGISLLEVQGRKAQLTEAGEALLRRSRSLTSMAQDIEQYAVNLKQGWEAEVHLSFEAIYPFADLMQIMAKFESQSRGTRVQLHETVLSGSSEVITQKKVDVAITPLIPQGFLGHKLGSMQLILVAHPLHPLVKTGNRTGNKIEGTIEEDELVQHLQIVIRDSGTGERSKGGWLKAEKRWTVGHFATAVALLKGGTGFAWIPKNLIDQELKLGELTPINLVHRASFELPFHLVVPNPASLGPAAQLLAQIIQQHHQ
jgi:DNA-binding transcriptional LysR family regulator